MRRIRELVWGLANRSCFGVLFSRVVRVLYHWTVLC